MTDASPYFDHPTARVHAPPARFVPCLRLFEERLIAIDPTAALGHRDVTRAVLSLRFDYGASSVRPGDEDDDVLADTAAGPRVVTRDRLGESRAQALLESFGALELCCLEHLVAAHDGEADYLVQADDDPHALCSFWKTALPRLRAAGFRVEIDPEYPYQVVDLDLDAGWFVRVQRGSARRARRSREEPSPPPTPLSARAPTRSEDWFTLELGVDVGSERVDLLPALLELIGELSEGDGFEALNRVTGSHRAVALGDGRWVCLRPEQLSRLLTVLRELYGDLPPPGERPPLPIGDAPGLLALDEILGEISLEGDVEALERERGVRSPPERRPPPSGLTVTLRPYQREGVDWMQHLRAHGGGGVLADDMGLGKTLQTIAHLLLEREQGRADRPSLVVVPKSLLGNWQREIARFAPSLRVVALQGARRSQRREAARDADVILTTYPVLARDQAWFESVPLHYLVLDEAQAIKNPRSQARAAVVALAARHRLCLTGTPVENDLGELWSLFDFLMPGLLGDATGFARRVRFPIERERDAGALRKLRERVAPYILRRTKQGVVRELPPKTRVLTAVELGAEQRELYEGLRVAAHAEVRRAIRTKGFAASTVTILDALMKLRQVCCDPRLVNAESARDVRRSAKTEAFFELTEGLLAEGRRILVFSQFTRMLGLLSEGLRQREVRHLGLTGATQDRQRLVDAFERGEADVFLISLKAGGTGLNLVSADTVIHFDPWWNAAAQAQATDRAYRIGQTRPVFVHDLIVAGSVEERMLALQEDKRRLASALLGEDPGGAGGGALDEDTVEDLLAPLEEE